MHGMTVSSGLARKPSMAQINGCDWGIADNPI